MEKTKESPISPRHAYHNSQRDLPVKSASAKKLIEFLCKEKEISKAISLCLVGRKKISQLHADFFDDPSPTDCITFPLDDDTLQGEIVVCPKIALEYDPQNPYVETSLYIIHSFLHLLGYDDIQPKERRRMEREQQRLLKKAIKLRCILETSSSP